MFQTTSLVTLAVLACGFALQAQTVTLAATRGSYSFVEDGVNAQGLHYTRIGTFRLDGSGAVTGASVSKTASGAALASVLSGSYLMSEDGSIAVQFVTTESDGEGDAVTVLNSAMSLLPSGKSRWTGLRTDGGFNAVIQAEPLASTSISSAVTYTLLEDGFSALNAPYSVVGTVRWDAKAEVSASLLRKTSTLEAVPVSGTLLVNPDGIASLVLLGMSSEGEVLFRASYAGVPV